MKATFHPDAEIDVAEAAELYEREGSPELAARFVAEIKRAVNLLLSAWPKSNKCYTNQRVRGIIRGRRISIQGIEVIVRLL